jgi:uncharacterized protein YndB with AHSA1/START domain
MNSTATGSADTREDAIVQEIAIRGSAERIFDALTKPEELVKWWGVAGKFQLTQVESDLRPGGRWSFLLATAGGPRTVCGEYRQIERPHLLVYSWIREQEDAAETVVRWELEESSGITRVRVTHSGLSSEALHARNSGWPMIVALLQSYVEGRDEH